MTTTARRRWTTGRCLAGLMALSAAACSDAAPPSRTLARSPLSAPTTMAAPPVTTAPAATVATTTVVTAPPTTAAPPPGLGPGASGPEVQNLETRLDALRYDAGPVDGRFDGATASAVMAFQKVTGLRRSGRATDDVIAALATATPPPALVPGGGAVRVEIDLPRQVMFLYADNALLKILPVSTGSGARYCSEGRCSKAVTPAGSYRIGRRIKGWHTSPLGRLYNPLFFNGGIAIHGSRSVPAHPASHGCVRITVGQAEWFPTVVPTGTPVYVHGGGAAPVPFTEPAPGPPPPVPPTAPPVVPTPSTLPPPSPYYDPGTTTTTAPSGGVFFPPPPG